MRMRTRVLAAALAVVVLLLTIHVSLNGLPDLSALNPHG